ncbi:MAG: EF-hand domain-containing protein [Chthoniobacteraceae bacterium]
MKSLTTILTILAMGTLFVTAAEEKPAAGAAKPEAAAGAKPAAEGAKPKPDPEKMFKKLDTNGDGKVSSEEFMASPGAKKDAAKAEASFAKKDKDGDKSLTLEEFSAAGGKKKNK